MTDFQHYLYDDSFTFITAQLSKRMRTVHIRILFQLVERIRIVVAAVGAVAIVAFRPDVDAGSSGVLIAWRELEEITVAGVMGAIETPAPISGRSFICAVAYSGNIKRNLAFELLRYHVERVNQNRF